MSLHSSSSAHEVLAESLSTHQVRPLATAPLSPSKKPLAGTGTTESGGPRELRRAQRANLLNQAQHTVIQRRWQTIFTSSAEISRRGNKYIIL